MGFKPFDDLADELSVEILRNLDYGDLTRCCLVCHHWNNLITEYGQLRYIVELGMDGVIDTGNSQIPHGDRLQLLRDQRHAWRNLVWRKQIGLNIAGRCRSYELVGGAFILSNFQQDFHVSHLPTMTSPAHQFVRADLGFPARDFACDPSQDLVVFVEEERKPAHIIATEGRDVHLHIRTLSSHDLHPAANKHSLSIHVPPHPDMRDNDLLDTPLHLADDVIAGLVCTRGKTRLVLWDWKKGFVIFDSSDDGAPYPTTFGFSFLSPRAYIIAFPSNPGCIRVFSFENKPRENNHPPTFVVSLLFPPVNLGTMISQLTAHTGPFYSRSTSSRPFTTSPTSRLQVVSLEYEVIPTHRPAARYMCFIQNSALISYIEAYERGEQKEHRYILWKYWGPHNTRLVLEQYAFSWLRFVEGERVVIRVQEHYAPSSLQVLDFNRQRTLSISTNLPMDEPDVSYKIMSEPSVLETNDIFKEPVVTDLLYHTVTRKVSDLCSAYMIDEERIVGLNVQGLGDEISDLNVLVM